MVRPTGVQCGVPVVLFTRSQASIVRRARTPSTFARICAHTTLVKTLRVCDPHPPLTYEYGLRNNPGEGYLEQKSNLAS
jgi:hypothetical protein